MAHPAYDLPLPSAMRPLQVQPVALEMAGLVHWMERSSPQDLKLCRSVSGIRQAMGRGRARRGHACGRRRSGRAIPVSRQGVRSIGPVWSRPTVIGHGVAMAFPGTPDIGLSLTSEGKDIVRLCNELGIMIDPSHMNEAGFDDVAALSSTALVATHSNAFAACASPRNLTDRQLHQIRDSGGMAGLNFATFILKESGSASADTSWQDMLPHMDHMITQLGEDHVGLGSDFDGCVVPDLIEDVTGVQGLFRCHGRPWM
jgi:membrane dipeptidase